MKQKTAFSEKKTNVLELIQKSGIGQYKFVIMSIFTFVAVGSAAVASALVKTYDLFGIAFITARLILDMKMHPKRNAVVPI
jgi:hypothetical protein